MIPLLAFNPVVRLVHNRKKKLNKKGTAIVQVEITYKNKRKFLSTGVLVKPPHWNGRVIKHKDAIHLNKQIDKFKQKGSYVDFDNEDSGGISLVAETPFLSLSYLYIPYTQAFSPE